MRIVHLSSSDQGGGASLAAHRLHESLRRVGVDSKMLVAKERSGRDEVFGPRSALAKAEARLYSLFDRLPLHLYRRAGRSPFSNNLVPSRIRRRLCALAPEVVHLHWFHNGFLDLWSLPALGSPVVWTLHDMWALTGGCHYDGNCGGYMRGCGACPALGSLSTNDLSSLNWKLKQHIYRKSDLTLVAPSQWLARLAEESPLLRRFPVYVLPNAIDTEVFRPLDRAFARKVLNLPQEAKLVLYGAVNSTADPRKGYRELNEACAQLSKGSDEIALVVFGSTGESADTLHDLRTFHLGRLNDEISLSLAYAAADVFVCPSRQDNLPNTIVEALACGMPTVAFGIGGMPDLIDHEKDGFLANPFDTSHLAHGIAWCLEPTRRDHLSAAARSKAVQRYSMDVVAKRHRELYQQLLGGD